MNGDVEMMDESSEKVAILDAGAQYGKVIDRRVRELSVESIILPLNTSPAELKKQNIRAVIISGGPGSVYDSGAPNWDPTILTSGIPILGICYGMQLLNRDSPGGKVVKTQAREDGQFAVNMDTTSPLYKNLNKTEQLLLTHGDSCTEISPSLKVNATFDKTIAGIENREKKIYGVQFHPEVDLSVNGKTIMKNFLIDIAGCKPIYTMKSRQKACIDEITCLAGSSKVLALVSGGVDSSVCTALLHKAIGAERVVAVHIDNGFLRKEESKKVKESLEAIGLKLHVYNESHNFYHGTTRIPRKLGNNVVNIEAGPLHSVVKPEEKRKIIGDTFMKVSDFIMKDLNLDPETTLLAQGTLRPDLIESASTLASGNANTIKTHHNDSQLVRLLREKGRVIEPLKDFHKDEVRQLGTELGLPDALVQRHPFPGPGLAIRVLCAQEKYSCKDFSEISNLLGFIVNYSNALKKPHPLLNRIQNGLPEIEIQMLKDISSTHTFTSTLLPIRTVGVQGDCRTYSYVAALSSDNENPSWESLMKLSKIIPKLCPVNRVTYVFGGKVNYPIQEITHTTLTSNVLSLLRQVDSLANETLLKHDQMKKITQMPIVLIPVHFDIDPISRDPHCQRSVVIRPFLTNDFMTGVAAQPEKDLPIKVLSEMVSKIQAVAGISRVLYDLTSKPPGTTEWE